jgi:hypothetical protein
MECTHNHTHTFARHSLIFTMIIDNEYINTNTCYCLNYISTWFFWHYPKIYTIYCLLWCLYLDILCVHCIPLANMRYSPQSYYKHTHLFILYPHEYDRWLYSVYINICECVRVFCIFTLRIFSTSDIVCKASISICTACTPTNLLSALLSA